MLNLPVPTRTILVLNFASITLIANVHQLPRNFSSQYNVKAIFNWKYHTNGDPMVDVGYFLMMFLQPAVYGYRMLWDIKLLIGKLIACITTQTCKHARLALYGYNYMCVYNI